MGRTPCWFCLRPIRPGNKVNKHHVLPKRYLRGNTNRGNLVVLVCRDCHCQWHRDFDLQAAGFSVFIVWMHLVNFGHGIYRDVEPASTQPRPFMADGRSVAHAAR